MNTRTAALTLLVGLLLVAAGVVQYVVARDRQREEQAALDRQWSNVQREAAQRFPRTLPGQERPAPAQLRGMEWAVCLLAGGAVLCAVGLGALVWKSPPEGQQ